MNDEHQKVPSYWDMLRMNMRAYGVWRALFTELASWSAFIIGFLVIVGLSLYAVGWVTDNVEIAVKGWGKTTPKVQSEQKRIDKCRAMGGAPILDKDFRFKECRLK